MIIYKTVNAINGKFYIGQDTNNNPKYLGSGTLIKLAIKKYGRENFQKEILEYCSTQEELNEKEKYWIKETKAIKLGYNLAEGGFGVSNMSDEIKEKISKSKKGKKLNLTEEQRQQYSLRMKNRKISEEARKKIVQAHKGKKLSQEHIKKLSESNKGKKLTEEQKRKIGEKSKGRRHTEEAKRKIGLFNKGKKHSEETKKLIGESGRGRKISAEHKQIIINAMKGNQWNKGRTHTEEAKEKIRIASTGRMHSEETKRKLCEVQPTRKRVCMINPKTKEILKIYMSVNCAAKDNNLNRCNISTCLTGKTNRKLVGGYEWKFYEEN
jgi:group I intron endonuclease